MSDSELHATKGDLAAMEQRIKDTICAKVKNVKEDVHGHTKSLYGEDGRQGLVRDVNWLKGLVAMVTGTVALVVAFFKGH